MGENDDNTSLQRREFLKKAGIALGGIILLPYGCSQSDHGVTASAPSTNYNFFKILDGSSSKLPKPVAITPGLLINDADRIVFYGDLGDDNYALYELFMEYGSGGPVVQDVRIAVETGQDYGGGQPLRRINRADTNGRGDLALVLDFHQVRGGSNDVPPPPEPNQLPAVFVRADSDMERILGFGDSAPDGGTFGGAFGDLAINDRRDLLLVSHHVSEADDFGHSLFNLAGASRSNARTLLSSSVAMQGRANSFVRGFGLVDRFGDSNFVAQTQIAQRSLLTAAPGAGGDSAGSVGALIRGSAAGGRMAAPPRLLSAPPGFHLEADVQGEIIMGARAGADEAAAWITHSDDGETQRLFFGSNSQPVTEIANTAGEEPIYAFSAPVLSGNGTLSYLQINSEENSPPELKVVGSGAPETVLRVGDLIDGAPITALMYGYHSRQADSAGRIVVYAEFGDGEPAILVGIPG